MGNRQSPLHPFSGFSKFSGRNLKKKKTTKMKLLLLVLILGVASISGITGSVIPETKDVKRGLISEADMVAQLPAIIAKFKPIIMEYAKTILDSSLSLQQKVNHIWDATMTNDNMDALIKLVGSAASKVILKEIVVAAAGSLGR